MRKLAIPLDAEREDQAKDRKNHLKDCLSNQDFQQAVVKIQIGKITSEVILLTE